MSAVTKAERPAERTYPWFRGRGISWGV